MPRKILHTFWTSQSPFLGEGTSGYQWWISQLGSTIFTGFSQGNSNINRPRKHRSPSYKWRIFIPKITPPKKETPGEVSQKKQKGMLSISKIFQNSSSCSVFMFVSVDVTVMGIWVKLPPTSYHSSPKWHCTQPQNFKCSTWQKIGHYIKSRNFFIPHKKQLCQRFSKLNDFSENSTKDVYIIIYYIYSIFCFLTLIRIQRRKTCPFYYENSAKTRWILLGHSTAASVTAKLLRCIRISFPSLGGFLGGWPKDPKKGGQKKNRGSWFGLEISIKKP